MKVGNLAMFDKKNETCIGPHEYAFLMNIRSIFGNWRLPFFTAFDFKPTKEWYIEMIRLLYDELGLTVMLTTCDQGSNNRGLRTELKITAKKPFILHPCNDKVKVYWTFDEIHLFKSFVNHIRDDQCMLPSGSEFNADDFQDILNKRGNSEICMGSHLKQKQLSAKNQERQNVGHAVNLISRPTAEMFKHFYPDEPRKNEIAECITVMADMHQVMSSHDMEEKTNQLKAPYGKMSAC